MFCVVFWTLTAYFQGVNPVTGVVEGVHEMHGDKAAIDSVLKKRCVTADPEPEKWHAANLNFFFYYFRVSIAT